MASATTDMARRDRGRPREGDSYRSARPGPSLPPPACTDEEKQAAAKAEYEKLLTMRSGGTYIPPARLRALQAQITDKTSSEYQHMAWEALKKSINGLINKVNTANIKHIVPELFGENLVRGRGLFCRSIMKAQAASLPFTPIYAAMAAVVNTKLPQVGELLVKRLVMQFRKGFKRNDKAVCLSSTTFLAHLINHQVQHEMLAGQILLLLLHKPTDDGVEIAVGFCREVGQYVEEMQPSIAMAVFDRFRNILHEAGIDKRTQYMIEVLFQVRKDKFKDHPAVRQELDLVEEEDQITHQVNLEGDIDVQDGLNIFKFDPDWEDNEEAYKKLRAEILGEASDDEGPDDDDDDGDGDGESDDEEDEETKAMEIKDLSNADLVNLRRTIYLTIMSSANPEEAVHKLMKINLPAGQEPELPSMIVECCSQEKTYTKFFGLIGERFAKINRLWCDLFEQAFTKYYETIHRYENNKLRNIAMLFGHMFAEDAIGWHCLSVIHLNEDETTSSSRIFIKILFQAMAEEMGMPKLRARLNDGALQPSFEGIFPGTWPATFASPSTTLPASAWGPSPRRCASTCRTCRSRRCPPPRPGTTRTRTRCRATRPTRGRRTRRGRGRGLGQGQAAADARRRGRRRVGARGLGTLAADRARGPRAPCRAPARRAPPSPPGGHGTRTLPRRRAGVVATTAGAYRARRPRRGGAGGRGARRTARTTVRRRQRPGGGPVRDPRSPPPRASAGRRRGRVPEEQLVGGRGAAAGRRTRQPVSLVRLAVASAPPQRPRRQPLAPAAPRRAGEDAAQPVPDAPPATCAAARQVGLVGRAQRREAAVPGGQAQVAAR